MIHAASTRAMPSDTLHTEAWKAAATATHCAVAWLRTQVYGVGRRRRPLRRGRRRRHAFPQGG